MHSTALKLTQMDPYRTYCEACSRLGIQPLNPKRFFYAMAGKANVPKSPAEYAAMTKAGIL